MSKIESYLKRSTLYPALILESLFSDKKRKWLINTTKILLLSIPIIIIASIVFSKYNDFEPQILSQFLGRKLIGLIFISLGLYIITQMMEAYFASVFYFNYIAKNNYKQNELYTFSAGRILRKVVNDNILTGLLLSHSIGHKILKRLGISTEEINILLKKQTAIKEPPIFNTQEITLVKVSDITNFIYNNHKDFKDLLSNHGLGQRDLDAVVSWVIYEIEKKEHERRWWTKDKLAKIPGVATDWSFGRTYLLNKFSRDILNDTEVYSENISLSGRERELEQVQSVLARSAGANAIIVGQPGQEKMEVIWNLCRRIKNKTIISNLINKKPLLFLTTFFSSSIESKEDFEKKVIIIFSEALEAGNIILIIDNLPKLLLQAKQFGINFFEMIEPFLASYNDQIIALADTEYFQTLIEPDQAIMSRFEVIRTKPLLLEEIIKMISRETINIEKIYGIYFTYPAILEIAKSADSYFPNGVSNDKAKDLLIELAPWAIKNNLENIDKDMVLEYIEEKTGIPTGSIIQKEKEILLDLENLLGKRVIAQTEAIFAIAGSIRRSRAGIQNDKRPLGSFLFLGPTGVGKTETAKALAEVFFGDEKLLLRLDMSEYQNTEALGRLIGSQENNTQGILANMLREHPYGVLLLDEFEKTNKDVLNLFLQIIDEGYFSDVFGKKVMARNIMFIATSNAGSEKIFELINQQENLQTQKEKIISQIIKEGVFKPELINRFDGTILFHPLTKENLSEIAKLMLNKLTKKLGGKGITLHIDKELIEFVVQGGYNPTFGARPMNRLIQDTIEQHLADLLIRGEITSGQTVGFKVLSLNGRKDGLRVVIN